MAYITFVLCVMILGVGRASAVPSVEGIVQPLDTAATAVPLNAAGAVWQREVETDAASTFLRLHFTEIAASGGADFHVRVKDRGNRVILDVPGSTFAKTTDHWTPYLPGTYALIEIENRSAVAGAQVSFKLAELGVQAFGAKTLSIQDLVNPKDRGIAYYANDAGITRVARSVAKLRYKKNNMLLTCTGFLVSENLLLTNQHCFDSSDVCGTAFAQFGYQEGADGLSRGEDFACEEIKDSDRGLDFTLLKLAGAPGARWGVLAWDLTAQKQGTRLYVVQHPGGRPKRVALDGCGVTKASAVGELAGKPTDLGHQCDTEDGSSGSPVFNRQHFVVGLHHLGFTKNDPDWHNQNRAVKAALVHARIKPFIQ